MKPRDRATDGPGGLTGAALFRQAQASCRGSLARLMAVHEGLVHAVVRKQVLGHLPYGEALQKVYLSLVRCAQVFFGYPLQGAAEEFYTVLDLALPE